MFTCGMLYHFVTNHGNVRAQIGKVSAKKQRRVLKALQALGQICLTTCFQASIIGTQNSGGLNVQGMRSVFLPLMLRLFNGLNNDLKVEDEVIKFF